MTPLATQRIRAGCKLNLYLDVLGLRSDGYHDIDSLFIPLPEPHDELTIEENNSTDLRLSCSLPELAGPGNTVRTAYELYAAATGLPLGLTVHIDKGIPHGAGLGGGSADAGLFLNWLNARARTKGHSGLSAEAMHALALRVGADVPFFLYKRPMRVSGTGDTLSPCPNPFSGWNLLVVCPDIHISTAWAFKAWDTFIQKNQQSCLTIIGERDRTRFVHGERVYNSFEAVVFLQWPELQKLKTFLLFSGSSAAALSGTGSSMFGLFRHREPAQKASSILRDKGLCVYQHIL